MVGGAKERFPSPAIFKLEKHFQVCILALFEVYELIRGIIISANIRYDIKLLVTIFNLEQPGYLGVHKRLSW